MYIDSTYHSYFYVHVYLCGSKLFLSWKKCPLLHYANTMFSTKYSVLQDSDSNWGWVRYYQILICRIVHQST